MALAGVAGLLTGCGMGPAASGPAAGPAITGIVHGGQQPVGSSQVYLYEAGTTGYGTGAQSLLKGPGYVTTDPVTGGFSITGDYSCTSESSLVYLVAVGGNPGLTPASTNNANLALMAALGPCSYWNGTNYTANPAQDVVINEVTTVASVYALAQFMTPGTYQVGTSSTNVTGLTNAFANVNNLVDIASGTARAKTPAGNGTVPQQEINTLADILATCVNSAGGTGNCSTLIGDATPSGETVPSDTIGVALSIALNPSNAVSTLNSLVTATAPFQPNFLVCNNCNPGSVPLDWTMSVIYYNVESGAGPAAVDANGNLWYCNGTGSTADIVVELDPTGKVLNGAGYSLSNSGSCADITIDVSGNIWVLAAYPGAEHGLVELNNSGTVLSPSPYGYVYSGSNFYEADYLASDASGNIYVSAPQRIDVYNPGNSNFTDYNGSNGGLTYTTLALDTQGDIWTSCQNSNGDQVCEITPSGITYYKPTLSNDFLGLAIDHSGSVWLATGASSTVSTNSLVRISGGQISYFTGGGLSGPDQAGYGSNGIAIDGAGHVWVTNNGFVSGFASEFDNQGDAISPAASGMIKNNGYAISGFEIDASGSIWFGNYANSNTLYQVIGVAAPVTTPKALALKNNALGVRP